MKSLMAYVSTGLRPPKGKKKRMGRGYWPATVQESFVEFWKGSPCSFSNLWEILDDSMPEHILNV